MSGPRHSGGDPVLDEGAGPVLDEGAGPVPDEEDEPVLDEGDREDGGAARAVAEREPLGKSEVVIAVAEHLRAAGMHVDVAWDRPLGIDIEATGSRHLIIQAAPEQPSGEAQADAFYLALGQLVGHASDAEASYALALPDNDECRSLVGHLPPLARSALRLGVFFVGVSGEVAIVEEMRLA